MGELLRYFAGGGGVYGVGRGEGGGEICVGIVAYM